MIIKDFLEITNIDTGYDIDIIINNKFLDVPIKELLEMPKWANAEITEISANPIDDYSCEIVLTVKEQ